MTISTQKPQVPVVRFPVLKTLTPTVLATFGLSLSRAVNVVNVENANVGFRTFRALTSKGSNQLKLACPNTSLVGLVAVRIPEIVAAGVGAIGQRRRLLALLAFSVKAPSVSLIARATTVSAISAFE